MHTTDLCTRPQSINRKRPTTYDVTSEDKVIIVFLASLDLGSGCRYGHYIDIIRNFYRCLHNEDGEYLDKLYIAEN